MNIKSKTMVFVLLAATVFTGCAQQKETQQSATARPSVPGDVTAAAFVPASAGNGSAAIDLGAPTTAPGASTSQQGAAAVGPASASEIAPGKLVVDVQDAVFCADVKDRVPQGVASSFDKAVKKVYFFTRVTKSQKPTTISHVWYWKEKKMAEVPLDVRSDNWRTWSSKKIDPSWTGPWAVKVLDENGEVVTTKNFDVQ